VVESINSIVDDIRSKLKLCYDVDNFNIDNLEKTYVRDRFSITESNTLIDLSTTSLNRRIIIRIDNND